MSRRGFTAEGLRQDTEGGERTGGREGRSRKEREWVKRGGMHFGTWIFFLLHFALKDRNRVNHKKRKEMEYVERKNTL